LAALRAIRTEHRLPEECFSQRRKVAKGMARVGFTTKITEITKGGKKGLLAESLRAWRLCARAFVGLN
jgi:hypothetical protein